MSNFPRIPFAENDNIEPGVGRTLTAWLRYDWSSRNKELFLEDQIQGVSSRTETERLYRFQVHLPPLSFEQAPEVMELTANTWDDGGDRLNPDEPMATQIAKRLFHASSHCFPCISSSNPFLATWEGGESGTSFITKFQGKILRISVTEI